MIMKNYVYFQGFPLKIWRLKKSYEVILCRLPAFEGLDAQKRLWHLYKQYRIDYYRFMQKTDNFEFLYEFPLAIETYAVF